MRTQRWVAFVVVVGGMLGVVGSLVAQEKALCLLTVAARTSSRKIRWRPFGAAMRRDSAAG